MQMTEVQLSGWNGDGAGEGKPNVDIRVSTDRRRRRAKHFYRLNFATWLTAQEGFYSF